MRFCAIAIAMLAVLTESSTSACSATETEPADSRLSTLLAAPLTASLSKHPAAQPPLKFDTHETAEENTRRLHSRKSNYLLAQVIARRGQLPRLDKLIGATCQVQVGTGETATTAGGQVFAFEFSDSVNVTVFVRVDATKLQASSVPTSDASVRFAK